MKVLVLLTLCSAGIFVTGSSLIVLPITSDNDKLKLLKSAREGDIPTVKKLLESGVNPNTSDTSGTPLSNAAYRGHTEIIKILLKYDAKTDIIRFLLDSHPVTLVSHLESQKLSLGKLEYMRIHELDYGTPLCEATKRGHIDSVRLLLGHNKCERTGFMGTKNLQAAFHIALQIGHRDLIMLFLDEGAKVKKPDSIPYEVCPLHAALGGISRDDPCPNPMPVDEKIALLLERGAALSMANGRNNSPLILALIRESRTGLSTLIKHGAQFGPGCYLPHTISNPANIETITSLLLLCNLGILGDDPRNEGYNVDDCINYGRLDPYEDNIKMILLLKVIAEGGSQGVCSLFLKMVAKQLGSSIEHQNAEKVLALIAQCTLIGCSSKEDTKKSRDRLRCTLLVLRKLTLFPRDLQVYLLEFLHEDIAHILLYDLFNEYPIKNAPLLRKPTVLTTAAKYILDTHRPLIAAIVEDLENHKTQGVLPEANVETMKKILDTANLEALFLHAIREGLSARILDNTRVQKDKK